MHSPHITELSGHHGQPMNARYLIVLTAVDLQSNEEVATTESHLAELEATLAELRSQLAGLIAGNVQFEQKLSDRRKSLVRASTSW